MPPARSFRSPILLAGWQRWFGSRVWVLLKITLLATGGGVATHLSAAPQAVFELELSATNSAQEFTWLEWSTDLSNWTPVARDYGRNWENTFPHRLSIIQTDGVSVLVDPINAPSRFYRVRSADTASVALSNKQLAARFLQQATFGPTPEAIENFPGVVESADLNDAEYEVFEEWIDAEIARPVSSHRAFWRQRANPSFIDAKAVTDHPFPNSPFEVANSEGHQLQHIDENNLRKPVPRAFATDTGRNELDNILGWTEIKRVIWYHMALTANDALRQRMAWCLSQIFVLGETGAVHIDETESFLVYYDIFVRNAFGNFGDILKEVTFSPRMADYLTYLGNAKADGTRFPDENYAREVMQLFTIGLWELNQDGSRKLDENGAPIPTYDNSDIETFARIFTGLETQAPRPNIEMVNRDLNLVDPLRVDVNKHDFRFDGGWEKILLNGNDLGEYPKTEAGAKDKINAFLDHLVKHENTAPFIARLLIQRLTVSNPSPRYIQAVAEAFSSGTYNGNGLGQRGDLTATLKAILLHPEAREPALALDDAHGKLREPLIRFLSFARAFTLTSSQTFGFFPIRDMGNLLFQEPYNSPSVFNFYLSDHEPAGAIQSRGLVAPEFAINNDTASIAFNNAIRTLLLSGLQKPIGPHGYSQATLNIEKEIGLTDVDDLLNHLDDLLTAGRLTESNREGIKLFLTPIDVQMNRNLTALYLFSLLPEFNILY